MTDQMRIEEIRSEYEKGDFYNEARAEDAVGNLLAALDERDKGVAAVAETNAKLREALDESRAEVERLFTSSSVQANRAEGSEAHFKRQAQEIKRLRAEVERLRRVRDAAQELEDANPADPDQDDWMERCALRHWLREAEGDAA